MNNILHDIDGDGPLSIVDLDPFNPKILVFHQGKARSLDALDAGYDVPQNVGQCGMMPKLLFYRFVKMWRKSC
ncbi:hypothetical protein [uncultured Nitrospira sp.]|uniref:hypothetical protein n=1 Tax=uncultured Nitrospira sp. TaxID=157176 RepID=UPI0031401288